MGKISAFVFTTLEGYYKGAHDDTDWHNHGEEELKYSEENLASGDTLLFGRVTYEHMKSFWPTPAAAQMMPKVAEGMNKSAKLVVSRTLKQPGWDNTVVLGTDWVTKLKEMKAAKNITLLGSGSVLTHLANENLLDEFQIMINPVAIGSGTSIFEGLKQPLNLHLESHRVFSSGILLLIYSKKNY